MMNKNAPKSSKQQLAIVPKEEELSRRERQIMEILYEAGAATAQEVQDRLPEAPSNSAVRTLLKILEEKGAIRHEQVGIRFVYSPVVTRERARRSALRRLMQTFFEGSPEKVVAALLEDREQAVSPEELSRIRKLIDGARKAGR